MKLVKLKLMAFGPFTGTILDLGEGAHGLHMVYGLNEAGKSSALRALSQLLYGIDERTTDSFVHSYTSLRVGAVLRHSDGAELEIVRRKARINSLRGVGDATILDQSALDRFLGGVDRDTFATLFGIDHATLESGGAEIVKGEGKLGPLLFETSLGIVGLRAVRQALQDESEGLFKPSGKKQRINETIHEYLNARSAIRNSQLSASEWSKHDSALRAATESRDKLDREWHLKSREHNRIVRIRNALPSIAQRKKLLSELDAFREAVLLADDFGDRVRDALFNCRSAQDQCRQADEAIERLTPEIEKLVVPELLLQHGERIEKLQRKLGEIEKGSEDRPQRVLQKKYVEHDAKEILKKLGKAPELEKAEELRLRVDEPISIQNLGAQHQGLLADCRNNDQRVRGLRERIQKLETEIGDLPKVAEPVQLRRMIRRVQQQGSLERDLADAEQLLERVEKQVAIELARLPRWSGALETLEALPLPSTATVDRFEGDFEAAENRVATLEDRIAEEQANVEQKESEVRQLDLQQEVPSERELEQARQDRDAGWRLVREDWQSGDAPGDEVASFVAKYAPASDLAEAYEHSVARSDRVADRLRREADRVARKAEFVIQREKSVGVIKKLTDQIQHQKTELEGLRKDWQSLWTPLGFPLLPPKEMRIWMRQHFDLCQKSQAIREQRDRVGLLRKSKMELRHELGACLLALAESDAPEDESLAHLLERSLGVLERHEQVINQRTQLGKEIQDRQEELEIAETEASVAIEALRKWHREWTSAMVRLGLPDTALPAAANTFLAAIAELFGRLKDARDFESRINGIDRDAEDFAINVQELVRHVAPSLEALPAVAAARELYASLTRARDANNRRHALEEQREDERKKRKVASDALSAANCDLEQMCQEARCNAPDELVEAARRSARRKELEAAIRDRDEQILMHSAGGTADELIAQAETVDPDALEAEIEKLIQEVAALREQMSNLDQAIGSEKTELARMTGTGAAAEAAEAAESLLARLETDVHNYGTLRLAEIVLQRGIERFREKTQGKVLERASRTFAGLTVRSFNGLRIDYDDEGEPILVGIRAGNSQIVGVAGMSDGSCDQLYLALRLAALESWLDSHEPIPLIVDDISIKIDNERAVAALKELAELSRRTQVIFFTHHKHLVELAQRSLPSEVLFTHFLTHDPISPS